MVPATLAAAEELAGEGVAAEVIDVATIKPLDEETIAGSVANTGRAVIIHEAAMTAGYGAEIVARLTASDFFELEAPLVRVAGYDTVMPLARLERAYLPDAAQIAAAARRTLTD
jgi:pyruvate dehydrogenase E1 component beta subunit